MHGDVVLQQPLNIAMLGKDERLLLGAADGLQAAKQPVHFRRLAAVIAQVLSDECFYECDACASDTFATRVKKLIFFISLRLTSG